MVSTQITTFWIKLWLCHTASAITSCQKSWKRLFSSAWVCMFVTKITKVVRGFGRILACVLLYYYTVYILDVIADCFYTFVYSSKRPKCCYNEKLNVHVSAFQCTMVYVMKISIHLSELTSRTSCDFCFLNEGSDIVDFITHDPQWQIHIAALLCLCVYPPIVLSTLISYSLAFPITRKSSWDTLPFVPITIPSVSCFLTSYILSTTQSPSSFSPTTND